MIRHIVLFTVPGEHLDAAQAGLKPLERIAHADVLEIRRTLRGDQLSREADLVVYGEFADESQGGRNLRAGDPDGVPAAPSARSRRHRVV
jgi:hypothetical protein